MNKTSILKLRLITGFILLIFMFLHLINLSFGNISLELMERSQPYLMFPFSNPIGVVILLLAIVTHMILGITTIVSHSNRALSMREMKQIIPAVIVPFLLFRHVLGIITIMATGEQPSYIHIIYFHWIVNPVLVLEQTALVIFAWFHGVQGLLNWLRYKEYWCKLRHITNVIVVAIPIAAIFGYVHAGQLVLEISPLESQIFYEKIGSDLAFISPTNTVFYVVYTLVIVGVLAYRWIHYYRRLKKESLAIQYDNGEKARGCMEDSLLEISKRNHIEHKNLCNGHGRCTTCAVSIFEGYGNLSPLSEKERMNLSDEEIKENVRLACQAKICHTSNGLVSLKRLHGSPEIDMLQLWYLLQKRPRRERVRTMSVEADGG